MQSDLSRWAPMGEVKNSDAAPVQFLSRKKMTRRIL
jgi:hypothetical protein